MEEKRRMGMRDLSQCAIMVHEKEKIKWTKTSQRWAEGERERVIEMRVEGYM